MDLDIHIVWDEAGSQPEGQLMQRHTLDAAAAFFVGLFCTVVFIVPLGTFWGFPLETRLWGCSTAVDGAYEARIALFSQQLYHTVRVGLWGACDLSREGKEDAASVWVLPCRSSSSLVCLLTITAHVLLSRGGEGGASVALFAMLCCLQKRKKNKNTFIGALHHYLQDVTCKCTNEWARFNHIKWDVTVLTAGCWGLHDPVRVLCLSLTVLLSFRTPQLSNPRPSQKCFPKVF